MSVNEAIKKRRSIRIYEEGAKISDEHIKEILEAGMLAPSARNSRPWEFLIVKNREKLDEITNIPDSHYNMLKTASIAIIVCANLELSYKEFFPQDCAAATQNILLQSAELGLRNMLVWNISQRR